MQPFTDTVTDKAGNSLSSAFVTVRNQDGTIATIYSSDAGAAKANPFLTDSLGKIHFFAPNAHYTVGVRHVAFNGGLEIVTPIILDDPINPPPYVWSGGQINEVMFHDTFSGSGVVNTTPDITGGQSGQPNGYVTGDTAINADGSFQNASVTSANREIKSGGFVQGDLTYGPVIRGARVRSRSTYTLKATTDFRMFSRIVASGVGYARFRVWINSNLLLVQQNVLAISSYSWSTIGSLDIGAIIDGDQLVVEDAGHSIRVIYRNLIVGDFTGVPTKEFRTFPTTDSGVGFTSTANGPYLDELKIEDFPPVGVTGFVIFQDLFGGALDALIRSRTPDIGNAAATSFTTSVDHYDSATAQSLKANGSLTNISLKDTVLDGVGAAKYVYDAANLSGLGPLIVMSRQQCRTTWTIKRAVNTTIMLGHRVGAPLAPLFIIQIVNGETITCNQNISTRAMGATAVLHQFSIEAISIEDGDKIQVDDTGATITVTHIRGEEETLLGDFTGVDGTLFINNADPHLGFCGQGAVDTNESYLDEITVETL